MGCSTQTSMWTVLFGVCRHMLSGVPDLFVCFEGMQEAKEQSTFTAQSRVQ